MIITQYQSEYDKLTENSFKRIRKGEISSTSPIKRQKDFEYHIKYHS